jgi:hypothetical protein
VLVRRLRTRIATAPHSWAATADRELDRLGRRADRPRAPGETATAYAAALATRYRDPRLEAVGILVDDAVFAPTGPDGEARAHADSVLAEVRDAPVAPDPVSAPTEGAVPAAARVGGEGVPTRR